MPRRVGPRAHARKPADAGFLHDPPPCVCLVISTGSLPFGHPCNVGNRLMPIKSKIGRCRPSRKSADADFLHARLPSGHPCDSPRAAADDVGARLIARASGPMLHGQPISSPARHTMTFVSEKGRTRTQM
jgi:hypothetical protein